MTYLVMTVNTVFFQTQLERNLLLRQLEREKGFLEVEEGREHCVLKPKFSRINSCTSLKSKEPEFLRSCGGLIRILKWAWLPVRDVTVHTEMNQ